MNIGKKTLIDIVIISIVLFVTVFVKANSKVAVTLENCEPGTYVGMVQWLNNKTSYKDLPEAEIKRAGKLTIMLEPGEYAITHYVPRQDVRLKNGRVFTLPSKIIGFRDVVVTKTVTFSFGCDWVMKGAV